MILTHSHNTSIDRTPNASIQKSSFANLRSLGQAQMNALKAID
jgi:hypothetical protein